MPISTWHSPSSRKTSEDLPVSAQSTKGTGETLSQLIFLLESPRYFPEVVRWLLDE